MILVTGATGFIGRRLLKLLESSDDAIRILTRKLQLGYESIICDLERDQIPSSALESVNTVFPLAGFAHDLRDASKIKHLYRAINVDVAIRLAELAVQNGVKHLMLFNLRVG